MCGKQPTIMKLAVSNFTCGTGIIFFFFRGQFPDWQLEHVTQCDLPSQVARSG